LATVLLPERLRADRKEERMPYDMLKKYLIYAKRFIRPRISEVD